METFINFGGFQNFVDGTPLYEFDPEMEIESSLESIKMPPFPKTVTIHVTSRKAIRRLMSLFKYHEARDWNAKRRAYGWTTKMMRRQKKYEVKVWPTNRPTKRGKSCFASSAHCKMHMLTLCTPNNSPVTQARKATGCGLRLYGRESTRRLTMRRLFAIA